jgi:hypothetical protein
VLGYGKPVGWGAWLSPIIKIRGPRNPTYEERPTRFWTSFIRFFVRDGIRGLSNECTIFPRERIFNALAVVVHQIQIFDLFQRKVPKLADLGGHR